MPTLTKKFDNFAASNNGVKLQLSEIELHWRSLVNEIGCQVSLTIILLRRTMERNN